MDAIKKTAGNLQDVPVNVKVKLSGLWLAALFCWIYGDLLRLYSGDFKPGDSELGELISMEMLWMVSAITMIIPGVMVFLSLALMSKVNRWTNIIVGIFYTGYNLIGLIGGSYPSAYDKFLIFVGIVFTSLIVWYAWKWPKQEV
jgi:hypothetical protein